MPLYDKAFYGTLFLSLGLVAGVVPLYFFLFAVSAAIILSALFLSALLSNLSRRSSDAKEDSPRRLWLVFLFPLTFIGYGYSFFILNLSPVNLPPPGIPASLTGVVAGAPLAYERSQSFPFRLNSPYQGLIYVYTDLTENFRRGARLTLSGVPLISPSGRTIVRWPSISFLEHSTSPLSFLSALRQNMIDSFRRSLPPASAALLSGLTVGDRSGFTPAFRDALSASSTTHLVALSGYNITIIVSAFGLALGSIFSRRLTFALTAVGILLFVLLVGPEPSIVRAAVMGGIALLALSAGRRYSMRNAIAISALLMLIADPAAALDVGFELSFLALLGIVYLLPALSAIIGWDEHIVSFFNWRVHFLTTASAQLAVAPVLLYYFHSVSVLSLLSNLLILGTVPYAMLFGGLLAAVSLLGAAGRLLIDLLAFLANLILTYQIGVINFFASISLGRLSGELDRLGLLLAFLYYLALILLIIRHYRSLRSLLR